MISCRRYRRSRRSKTSSTPSYSASFTVEEARYFEAASTTVQVGSLHTISLQAPPLCFTRADPSILNKYSYSSVFTMDLGRLIVCLACSLKEIDDRIESTLSRGVMLATNAPNTWYSPFLHVMIFEAHWYKTAAQFPRLY